MSVSACVSVYVYALIFTYARVVGDWRFLIWKSGLNYPIFISAASDDSTLTNAKVPASCAHAFTSNTCTGRQANGQADRQTDGKPNKQTDKQTARHTDRQTDPPTDY